MRTYKDIFEKENFGGYMTMSQLKKHTECVRLYKGYAIAFGKYQRTDDGRAWWSVRVWKVDGKDCIGEFQAAALCATDGEAMFMATQWAKENIDAIVA